MKSMTGTEKFAAIVLSVMLVCLMVPISIVALTSSTADNFDNKLVKDIVVTDKYVFITFKSDPTILSLQIEEGDNITVNDVEKPLE